MDPWGRSGPGLRVLVVDDDIVVAMLLEMSLAEVTVIEATRMGEGLTSARSQRPDVVVVDRTLPDGDGLDLVRALRADPKTEDVPIVLVSAGHDPQDRSDVLRAGADDYLAKPFEPQDLEHLLRALVSVPAPERARRRTRARRLRPLRAAVEEARPSIVPPVVGEYSRTSTETSGKRRTPKTSGTQWTGSSEPPPTPGQSANLT